MTQARWGLVMAERDKSLNLRVSEAEKKTVRTYVEALHMENESDFMRTLIRSLQKKSRDEVVDFIYKGLSPMDLPGQVRVLGYIPGGQANEIRPLDDTITRAPDKVRIRPDLYALIVVGNSMAGLNGKSIEDGMFALFDPQKPRDNGCIAHVEFEENGIHKCTVKKLNFQSGGEWVDLKPTNPDPHYQTITMRVTDIEVKGVLVTAWRSG